MKTGGTLKAKILFLDIETAPAVAYVWGLHDQNIGINQIVKPGYVLCWAAQWLGGKMMFSSIRDGRLQMLTKMRDLLDEADAVIHYNGASFDIPTLNREFMKHEIDPPSPFKQIDLYRVIKRTARFDSGKLEFVSKDLSIGAKAHTGGFGLWEGCMGGDKKAWGTMEKYNRQDVALLVTLYKRILPWITTHPVLAPGLGHTCPKCGSSRQQRRGLAVLSSGAYPRYQCQGCGAWSRGSKSEVKRNPDRIIQI